MKMVAAAKLRRAQESILRARPYAYHVRKLVNSLVLRAESGSHALLRRETAGKVVLIIVTSDRGLCGAFNGSIVHATMNALTDQFAGRDVELVVLGRKGVEHFHRRKCTIRKTYTGLMEGNVMRSAQSLLDELIDEFAEGKIGELYCLYNEFKSALVQRVTLERLLPFEGSDGGDEVAVDYLYEPSQETVLGSLLVHNLYMQMHRILYESAASEHGARMTAMENATKNAGEMIDRLTLKYNRVRQDAITKEMIEIISGAEAL